MEIGDNHLIAGDGASHTIVKFRVLVFRPFIEEIIVGKIKSSNSEGLTINLGFFDDICIPSSALQQPCRFDESEQVWVWEYPNEDGGYHDLFMDAGEEIRFRVTSETFIDTSPSEPESLPNIKKTDSSSKSDKKDSKIPYQIHASINEPGLGLLSWWNNWIVTNKKEYEMHVFITITTL